MCHSKQNKRQNKVHKNFLISLYKKETRKLEQTKISRPIAHFDQIVTGTGRTKLGN